MFDAGLNSFALSSISRIHRERTRSNIQVGHAFAIETLQLELASEGELRCGGALRSDAAQRAFGQHLQDIHAHIVAKRLPSFTVDLRSLDFVNSSAIRVFINWISRAEGAGYETRLLRRIRAIAWHRLSFSALQSLAPKTVENVDVGARGKRRHVGSTMNAEISHRARRATACSEVRPPSTRPRVSRISSAPNVIRSAGKPRRWP